MKLKCLLLSNVLLSTFTLYSCGKEEKFSSKEKLPIHGTWKINLPETPEIPGTPDLPKIKFTMYLKFDYNKITSIGKCEFTNLKTETSVSSPAEYKADTVKILESHQSESNEGGLRCRASLDPGTIKYKIKDNVLYMRNANDPESDEEYTATRQ